MKQEPEIREQKKPYEPPKVVSINLRPEEAVLGHCKVTIHTTGPAGFCGLTCFDTGS